MSRSYKRVPLLKVNRGGRSSKRLANKKVRRTPTVADGKQYKKVYQKWDIYSQISYCTWEDFQQYTHLQKLYPTPDSLKQAWRQSFYNK